MSNKDTLPPLPEPSGGLTRRCGHKVFTGYQMQAYARAAIAAQAPTAQPAPAAQEPLKPLTQEQVDEVVFESGYAQNSAYALNLRTHFIRGLRGGERKHGITGAAK